jgi:hypothetical protein
VRKTFEYVFTVVPKNGWEVEQATDSLTLKNGDLEIFLNWRFDGCFIHVLDHSRKEYGYSLLKLNVYHHSKPVAVLDGKVIDRQGERRVEREMYEIAKNELMFMLEMRKQHILIELGPTEAETLVDTIEDHVREMHDLYGPYPTDNPETEDLGHDLDRLDEVRRKVVKALKKWEVQQREQSEG